MSDLKDQLRRWGNARKAYIAVKLDGKGHFTHQLEKAMSVAPGTRERAERQLLGRDGRSRRRYMAAAAGCGMRAVPMWACDPVPAKNDAGPPRDIHAAIMPEIPDELRWIDRALSRIAMKWPMRAEILREEFEGSGTQADKARRMADQYGGKLSLDQYKRELRRGLECLESTTIAA